MRKSCFLWGVIGFILLICGACTPISRDSSNLEIVLKYDESKAGVAELYVHDKKSGEERKTSTLEDVFIDHYHFIESHNGNVYLIRRIGYTGIENENWTDELWMYTINNKGKKLYASQGLDFRVSPNEKYIATTGDDKLLIIDTEGNEIRNYALEELSVYQEYNGDVPFLQMQEWSDDSLSFWSGLSEPGLILTLFKINTVDWSITKYDMTQLPIGDEIAFNPNNEKIAFSDYPMILDIDSLSEFEASKKKVSLFSYDLVEKKLIPIESSIAKMFEPEWIDDFTIEFNNPKGQDRIRYKLRD